MELDIRGEMEAAARELGIEDGELPQDESPSSDSETSETSEEARPADGGDPTTEGAQSEPAPDGSSDTNAAPEDSDELPLGGSIPVPRVRKIIENARKKAAAEVEARLRGQQPPAETDEQRAAREEAERFYRFANDNPLEFARRITSKLRQDPTYAGEAERIFQPTTPGKPENTDPKPEPDVILTDGRLVYSDGQMEKLLSWRDRKIEQKFEERVKPFEQDTHQRRFNAEVDSAAKRILDDAVTWAGMDSDENRKAVARHMMEKGVDINSAYRAVVVPKLKTDEKAIADRVRKEVLAELKRKGNASTTPPGAPASDPKKFEGKTVRQILEETALELGME